jgi:hypothetical protein
MRFDHGDRTVCRRESLSLVASDRLGRPQAVVAATFCTDPAIRCFFRRAVAAQRRQQFPRGLKPPWRVATDRHEMLDGTAIPIFASRSTFNRSTSTVQSRVRCLVALLMLSTE